MRRLHKNVMNDSSSSSDENDAFSAFSLKRRGKNRKKNNKTSSSLKSAGTSKDDSKSETNINRKEKSNDSSSNPKCDGDLAKKKLSTGGASETSSNKRHHHISSARQAKMEALLLELEDGPAISKISTNRPPPDKRGSFVEPGEEHLTTNIFVGNLAPDVTEEELTEAFRQFGDLYSVKIMWPRTAEERARGRNTGFVCFMTREDAEEAIDAYQDADPHFNFGRRLCLRWGKNVKKTVKRGTGGVPIAPIKGKRKKPLHQSNNHQNNHIIPNNIPSSQKIETNDSIINLQSSVQKPNETRKIENLHNSISHNISSTQHPDSQQSQSIATSSNANNSPHPNAESNSSQTQTPSPRTYNPELHGKTAIKVIVPKCPKRMKFITTVASFVAKDGSILERKLVERESNNIKFSFLQIPLVLQNNSGESDTLPDDNNEEQLQERIFYRWRVYAFTQGDGLDSWRTEPFVMFEPNGYFWIPPPLLDQEAARREKDEAQKKEDHIRIMQDERRRLAGKKHYMTGRQLEHAKYGNVAKGGGTDKELHNDDLEKWHHLINHKLCATKESICEVMVFCFDNSGAAQQISQLLKWALLDDRPCVETRISRLYVMSDVLFNSQQPGVKNAFRYRDAIEAMAPEVFVSLGKHKQGGRMTMNKLRNAVSAVLSAWTNWSVYNVIFIDQLQACFDNKEWNPDKEAASEIEKNPQAEEKSENVDENLKKDKEGECSKAQNEEIKTTPRGDWVDADVLPSDEKQTLNNDIDGEALSDVDGEALSDVDGEALSDVDGEALSDVDGEAFSDVDGEELEDGDVMDNEAG